MDLSLETMNIITNKLKNYELKLTLITYRGLINKEKRFPDENLNVKKEQNFTVNFSFRKKTVFFHE